MMKILLIDDEQESFILNNKRFLPSFETGYKDEKQKEEYKKYFTLDWLQSPDDIKDYLSFVHQISIRDGNQKLTKLDVIPEIVIFDYRLATGWVKNHSWVANIHNYIPTFRMAKELKLSLTRKEPKKIIQEFYEMNDIKENRSPESENIREELLSSFTTDDDNMGCYAGAMIIDQYKNYPCVGVPITSKGSTSIRGEAKYFEWILDEKFYGLFGSKYSTSPSWDELIPKALSLLRHRITALIMSQDILVKLDELFDIASNKISTDLSDETFSFISGYGERKLPLGGLFIDVEKHKRNEAIIQWVKGTDGKEETEPGLLGILANAVNTKIQILKDAKEKYLYIWNIYEKHFLRRFILSHYQALDTELSEKQKMVFLKLKNDYCQNGTNKFREDLCCSVEKVLSKNKKKANVIEKRLTILFLATKLWIAHRKGLSNNTNILSSNSNLQLVKDDYYNVLNPIENNSKCDCPISLLKHSKNVTESDYMENFQKWISRHNSEIPETSWHNFTSWIEDGEKVIVKALFFDQLSISGYPDWLIKI